MSWIIVAALFLFAVVGIYGLRPISRWRLRHIPGPRPTWLLGNVPDYIKFGGQYRADQVFAKKYGSVYKVLLGARSFVAVEEPELARKVLLHSSIRPNIFITSVMPREARERAQSSILWVHGDRWRSLRAAWQPMFFTGSLKGYFGIMDKAAQTLVAELKEVAAESQTVDMHRVLGDMTLEAVAAAAFGVSLHVQKADKSVMSPEEEARSRRLREAASSMFSPTGSSKWVMLAGAAPVLLPILRFVAPHMPDKPLRTLMQSRDTVNTVIAQLFADHRAALASGQDQKAPNGNAHVANGNHDAVKGADKLRKGVLPGSFIDLLLTGADRRTGEAFSDIAMAQQAITVLLAGFETTANTLAFACYLLARPCNAEKQAALAAEVDAFGRHQEPAFEDLDRLPYLDAVLKEALRLFPPAHSAVREADRDLNLAGMKVQKGQWLSVPIFSMHNNPSYWPDADVFLPERWLKGHPERAKQPKHAYMPFGEGSRVCIGMRFAMEEAKITLLRLYQSFTLELAPGQVCDSAEMWTRGARLLPYGRNCIWTESWDRPQFKT